MEQCSICGRDVPPEYMEEHHLIPKQAGGKETTPVCNACGDQIHSLFSNSELKKEFNTIEALLGSEKIQKWVRWISKRPTMYRVCNKKKKRR